MTAGTEFFGILPILSAMKKVKFDLQIKNKSAK
jgi:hypothetical protein